MCTFLRQHSLFGNYGHIDGDNAYVYRCVSNTHTEYHLSKQIDKSHSSIDTHTHILSISLVDSHRLSQEFLRLHFMLCEPKSRSYAYLCCHMLLLMSFFSCIFYFVCNPIPSSVIINLNNRINIFIFTMNNSKGTLHRKSDCG